MNNIKSIAHVFGCVENYKGEHSTQIVNRFKTVLKQKTVTQIYFAKQTLKMNAFVFIIF